jgi:hypothetical protein
MYMNKRLNEAENKLKNRLKSRYPGGRRADTILRKTVRELHPDGPAVQTQPLARWGE